MLCYFLNFVQSHILHFLFAKQAHVQSAKRNKLLIDWNEYQENSARIGFQFHSPKLVWENWFNLSFNCAGLCKDAVWNKQKVISNADHFNSIQNDRAKRLPPISISPVTSPSEEIAYKNFSLSVLILLSQYRNISMP